MGGGKPDVKFLYRAVIELSIFSAVVNVLLLVMPLYLLQVYDRVLPSSRSSAPSMATGLPPGSTRSSAAPSSRRR